MGGISHQKYTAAMPLGGDTVVDTVGDHVEDLHIGDVADECERLVAQLLGCRLLRPFGHRVKKAPAVRVPHQHHPFHRVGEVGKVGVVARIFEV